MVGGRSSKHGSGFFTKGIPRRETLTERRLSETVDRLKILRAELLVAEEHIFHLAARADDARIRSLVSETPLAGREHRDAERHAGAMRKHRDSVVTNIGHLEQLQDQLLDRLGEN